MQQKSVFRLFLEALGYVVAGNVMALVVTLSLLGFGNDNVLIVVASFCAISTYLMMTFSVGHKDGEQERKLVRVNRLEKPNPNKWLIIGIVAWLMLCVPCIILLFAPGFLIPFRFIFGALFAISLLFGSDTIPAWSNFVFIGIYALTPVFMMLGHYVGYFEKMTMDSIIYKKKK